MRLAMLRLDSKDQYGTIDRRNGRERSGASFGASREVWSSNGPLVGMKVLRARHDGVVLRGSNRGHQHTPLALCSCVPPRQLRSHSSPNTPQKLAFKRTLSAIHMLADRFGFDQAQGSNVNKD